MSERIAVVLPNWIGDVVMATPTLRALRKHYGPRAAIVGVMKPYVESVLEGTDWLDDTILADRRSADSELRTTTVVRELRQLAPDTVLLMTNSLWSAGVAWLSRAPQRIGYVRNGRGPLLTHRLYPPRSAGRRVPVSAVDYFLQLAYTVGCDPEPRQLELATLPRDEWIVDEIWRRLGLDQQEQVVVFNTGGAFGASKHWPEQHYIELARHIVGRHNAAVMVLCGPAERQTAARIARKVDRPHVFSMAEEDLSLGVAKSVVRRSQLMVTTDSGPRHFAAAFGVPVVSLFGPIDPRWSVTYHPGETTLLHEVDCGPCGKKVCPLAHHRCMRDLSVERVLRAVERKLARPERRRAA